MGNKKNTPSGRRRSVALVAGFIGLAAWGIWYNMNGGPSGTAPADPMAVPDLSGIAQGDPIADVTLPAELSADAKIGKRIFEARCAVCHGENAAGQNGIAPPLIHRFYRPGHHGDMAFVRAARNGVQAHHWRFGNMPPVKDITDGEVKMVVRYIRELQRANGIK